MNPFKKIGSVAAGVMLAVVSLFSVAFFVPPAPVRADPITLGALLGLVGGVFGIDFFSCSFNILFYCDSGGNVVGSYTAKGGDPCSSAPNACGQTNVGTLVCNGGSGGTAFGDSLVNRSSCSGTVDCNATPPPDSSCPVVTIPPGTGFYPDPSTVGRNGTTTLYWQTTKAKTCTIAGDNGFTHSGGASGSVTSNALTQTTTFTLTCNDGGPATSASIRVIVNARYKEI